MTLGLSRAVQGGTNATRRCGGAGYRDTRIYSYSRRESRLSFPRWYYIPAGDVRVTKVSLLRSTVSPLSGLAFMRIYGLCLRRLAIRENCVGLPWRMLIPIQVTLKFTIALGFQVLLIELASNR